MKVLTRVACRSCLALGLVVAASACGESASTAPSASAEGPKTAKPAPSASGKPKLTEVPALTVDQNGPSFAGERADLRDAPGREKLHRMVADLPINGKPVSLVILEKSKTRDVAAMISELGAAGAPSIKLKTFDARADVPEEYVIVPMAQVKEKPPPCSVVAMVGKDFSSNVWSIKGTTAKKLDKGLAGLDVGQTVEILAKEIKGCDSTVAFFSAAENHAWEQAHNIGGAIVNADADKKIKMLVYIDTPPIPGREVKVGP